MFTYFYTAITFDPKEIQNLQQSGGLPGIRPGATQKSLQRRHRTTLFGALFLGDCNS